MAAQTDMDSHFEPVFLLWGRGGAIVTLLPSPPWDLRHWPHTGACATQHVRQVASLTRLNHWGKFSHRTSLINLFFHPLFSFPHLFFLFPCSFLFPGGGAFHKSS